MENVFLGGDRVPTSCTTQQCRKHVREKVHGDATNPFVLYGGRAHQLREGDDLRGQVLRGTAEVGEPGGI